MGNFDSIWLLVGTVNIDKPLFMRFLCFWMSGKF